MKKRRKIKERVLSLVLTIAMVASLFTGMAPVEVYAAEGRPTDEERAETMITTFDVTLEKQGENYKCSKLPELKSDNYKWVYYYDPNHAVASSKYEENFEERKKFFQSLIDEKQKLGGAVVTILPGMNTDEIIDLENCQIPTDENYGMLIIMQVYDYDLNSEDPDLVGRGEMYWFHQVAVFDVSGKVEGSVEGETTFHNLLKPAGNEVVTIDPPDPVPEVTSSKTERINIKNPNYAELNLGVKIESKDGALCYPWSVVKYLYNVDHSYVVPGGDYIVSFCEVEAMTPDGQDEYGQNKYIVPEASVKEVPITVKGIQAPTPEECPSVGSGGPGALSVYNNKDTEFWYKIEDQYGNVYMGMGWKTVSAQSMGAYLQAVPSGVYYVSFCYKDAFNGYGEPSENAVCKIAVTVEGVKAPTLEEAPTIDATHPGVIHINNATDKKFCHQVTDKYGKVIKKWSQELSSVKNASVAPLEAGDYIVSFCFKEAYNYGYPAADAVLQVPVTVTEPQFKEGSMDTEKNEYIIDYKDGENVKVAIALNNLTDGDGVAKYYTFDEIDWYKLPDDEEVRIVVINSDPSVSPRTFICGGERDYDTNGAFYAFDWNVTFRDVSIEKNDDSSGEAVILGYGNVVMTIDGDVYVERLRHWGQLEVVGNGKNDTYTTQHMVLDDPKSSLIFRDIKKVCVVENDNGTLNLAYGPLTFLNIDKLELSLGWRSIHSSTTINFKNVKDFLITSPELCILTAYYNDSYVTFENSFGRLISCQENEEFDHCMETNAVYVILDKETEIKSGADAETAKVITLNEDKTVNLSDIGRYFEIVGEKTYDLTLDSTNLPNGNVSLYTYKSEGGNVETTYTNGETISMPIDGYARVFASEEFTVVAEGATIGEVIYLGVDEGYYCEITNFAADTTVVVNPKSHVHSLTQVPKAEANCTKDGCEAYYKCAGCEDIFADEEGKNTTTLEDLKIDRLGHDMAEATCTEPSKCKRKGCNYTEGSSVGHKLGELQKDENNHWKECSCGYKETEAHKCVWYIETEATDTVKGKMHGVCETCGQKVEKETPVTDETSGSGKVEVISPDTNANSAKINNPEDAQKYIPLTEDERAEIVSGEDLDIILEVTDITETVKKEDKEKIEAKMDTYKLGMYMDVSLWKKVGKRNKEYVSKASDKILIMFMMPESLRAGKGKERTYKVMRLHDGVVTVIDTNMNTTTGEISFETDSFSVYALVYEESVKATEAPTATPTEVPSVTPTEAPSVTPTEAPSVTPTEAPSATPTEAPSATPTEVPSVTNAVKQVLLPQVSKKSKNSIKISWNKIDGATGYEVYATTCGNYDYKLTKTVKSNKKSNCTITKVKGKKVANKNYKFRVKAYKLVDGKKVYIAKSKDIHLIKSYKKYGNAKAVSVKKAKITLNVGKTSKISATIKVSKGKKQSSTHGEEIRYISSDENVAKVSSKGKIKAVGKGKCKIYVLAVNGKYKAVSVTVK